MSKPCPTATIILASTSPRRIDMLRLAGFTPVVIAPAIDETPGRGELPKALVTRLAREKSTSVVARALEAHASVLVIAADTIVVAPNGRTILNKPGSRDEARRMLASLAGRTHTVHTGYAIVAADRAGGKPRATVRVVTSRVRMRKLTRADILAYVDTGEPMDKAGAYGAQGIGAALIERLQGSYTNVVGLPMAQLLMDLERLHGVALFAGMRAPSVARGLRAAGPRG